MFLLVWLMVASGLESKKKLFFLFFVFCFSPWGVSSFLFSFLFFRFFVFFLSSTYQWKEGLESTSTTMSIFNVIKHKTHSFVVYAISHIYIQYIYISFFFVVNATHFMYMYTIEMKM